MNSELRTKLNEITQKFPVILHSKKIEEIQIKTGHSISVQDFKLPLEDYTCVVQALGFQENEVYKAVAQYGFGRIFAGKEFVEFLLKQKLEELDYENSSKDDFVVYFNIKEFCHIGRIQSSGQVLSKWGSGILCLHDIWEVPSSYGNNVRFFSGFKMEYGIDSFHEFAQTKGIQIKSTG